MIEHSLRRLPHLGVIIVAGITLAAVTLVASSSSGAAPIKAVKGGTSAATRAPTNGVLTVGLLGDIGQPPDPDIFYAGNGLAIMKNVYQTLVQYAPNDAQVKIVPLLATSWSVNKNYTVWTFHLRHGVTFHDGTPFTSAAVGPSFARRTALKGGPSYMTQGVKSVATPNRYTAVVTLDAPNSAFLNYLASPFGPMMESPTALKLHAGNNYDQTYLMTHDIGTGPYELTSAKIGVGYVLTRYNNYWGPKGVFKTIDLPVYQEVAPLELALNSGAVNAVVSVTLPSSAIPYYEKDPSVKNYFLPMLTASLIDVNPYSKFFKTQRARLAFMEAINRPQLTSEVLGQIGTPANTIYGRGMIPGNVDTQEIPYDPSVMATYARTLPSGTPLTISYLASGLNGQVMAEILAAEMQSFGIDATAVAVTTAELFTFSEHPSKDPDVYIDSQDGPDGGNPYMWGHVFWDKTGGIDFFGCDSPAVDSELNEALLTNNTALYIKAGRTYSALGCTLTLAYLYDWVVADKWLTGIPDAHNLGANELNFNLLGIAKS